MTYKEAVDSAKIGLRVSRKGFFWRWLGYDGEKERLFTIDHSNHKAIFHPNKEDRDATDWFVVG